MVYTNTFERFKQFINIYKADDTAALKDYLFSMNAITDWVTFRSESGTLEVCVYRPRVLPIHFGRETLPSDSPNMSQIKLDL